MNEVTTGERACVSETAAQEEEDGGVVASWFVVDDETTSELSNLLDLFEAPPPPFRVRFIDDPYSSPVIFQSSSAYVTINGNEESCGSSFSDSESSVMASIDVGAARTTRGACLFEDVDVELGGFWMDGFDCGDEYDAEYATCVEFLGEIFE